MMEDLDEKFKKKYLLEQLNIFIILRIIQIKKKKRKKTIKQYNYIKHKYVLYTWKTKIKKE